MENRMTTDPAVQDKSISVNGLQLHYRDWGGD